MFRASLVRALMASAVLAVALTLAGCYGDDGYQLPTRAMKELSPEMLTLLDQKNMPKKSPILIRIFKEKSELEVWKQDTTARYELVKVYPICRWSGGLGPKVKEGDRQAPEGFYPISPGLINPNSSYYLAINIGFPNAFDKANGYSGAFLMIHGDCSSRGCYAMTDEQIGEIYSLAREAFLGGQKAFQVQAYPFRMTPANLARHRNNPNMAYWKMIKVGNDHFLVSHQEPKVDVCEKHYVFDAEPPAGFDQAAAFTPSGRCPVYETDPNDRRAGEGEAKERRLPVRAIVSPTWRRSDGERHRRRHEPRVHAQAGKSDLYLRRRRPLARAAVAAGPAAAADFDQDRRRSRAIVDTGGGTVIELLRRPVRLERASPRPTPVHRVYALLDEPRECADPYRPLRQPVLVEQHTASECAGRYRSRPQRLRRAGEAQKPAHSADRAKRHRHAKERTAGRRRHKATNTAPRPRLRSRPTARRRQAIMACSKARSPWCRPARSIIAGAFQ